jgi:hypothetical protein
MVNNAGVKPHVGPQVRFFYFGSCGFETPSQETAPFKDIIEHGS